MMFMRTLFLFASVQVCGIAAQGGEIEEVQRLAPKYKAEAEMRLSDGTRCDLLSSSVAFEVDYSRKWQEGIGQALHYSLLTGLRPGLKLLVEHPGNEWRHIHRAARICGKYGIDFHVELIK